MPLPTLDVWTKPSGYNLGRTPGWGTEVAVGNLIIGREYIIKDVGTTDFTTIGARANTPNVIFTATSTGSRAGEIPYPDITAISSAVGLVTFFVQSTQLFNIGDTISVVNVTPSVYNNSYKIVSLSQTGITVASMLTNPYISGGRITGVEPANHPGNGSAYEAFIREQNVFNQQLPVQNDTDVSYTVISGKLPPGLRISGNRLIGTPFEVVDYTLFTFCIRASKTGYSISDRTFSILVDGPDLPTFVTEAGSIAIGVHDQLYVLDKTYIDFQIEAFDLDTAAGQKLTYFISSGDGNLPPGVTMTSDGFISGYILPAPKIKPDDGAGTYDEGYYDAASYDFALRPTNGFDSYVYDQVFYDYNLPYTRPSSLNVNYQFKVTVTDGNHYAQRIFKIFVVGDDQFRADTTTSDGFASGLFTADVTYLRQPAWLTNTNIGLFRANNYLTIPVILYDASNVYYNLEYINQEVTCTSINVSITDNVKNSHYVTVTNVKGTILPNYYIVFEGIVEGATDQLYRVISVTDIGDDRYRLYVVSTLAVDIPNGTSFYIGSKSTLPAGTSFDLQTATVYGAVPYQPAITKNYNFTITAIRLGDKGDSARTSRTFTIGIIGEIDSVITWNSGGDLGTINANLVSTLKVSASSTITDAVVQYKLIDGKLPPGLTLNSDGEIVGKVSQFYDATTGKLGLTRFYDQPPQVPTKVFTTFDNDTSAFDKKYVFTIQAKDQYDYSATTRQFTILILTPNSIGYSNVRTHPFLKQSQRLTWKTFINDNSIFTPSSIYRTNDSNFGIQVNLDMLVYAGIETKSASAYMSAITLNHKRKRFAFGSVKSASAIVPGTKSTAYEVVYVEMKDLSESNGKHLPTQIKFNSVASDNITSDNSIDFWSRSIDVLLRDEPGLNRPEPIITIDSTGYQASNSNTNVYFPNSISLWRQRLKAIGSTERNYLPLWMRSIQPGTKEELGFVLAVPICYCKTGTSADILLNIAHSGFDFKTLDYTADRYIIDTVDNLSIDKYLIFRNDRITV